METTLIILRGNSGSGKTTIAKHLQKQWGEGTLLVSQDVIRRDMLNVRDRKKNLSIELIRQITKYGKGQCEYVILEGILSKERYGDMLCHLIDYYQGKVLIYYFDLPFEETVKRHQTRSKKSAFGETELRKWWNPHDYLGDERERIITKEMSELEIVKTIVEDSSVIPTR